jgi:SAM-dependent methyltransferase
MTTPRNRDDFPLWLDNCDDFARFRRVFQEANYTDKGVAEVLDLDNARAFSGRDVPYLLDLTSHGTPLETLIRLFLMGVPVDEASAGRAVLPMKLEEWIEAGFLAAEDGAIVGEVELLPYQDLLMAFDLPRRIEAGSCPNYVMGIGASSLTLANLTLRRRSESTLDLGTGCGFLAFLAAAHSARVLAVDSNPRAVSMAAFNARLNGLQNVECLQGDFFQPVAGQNFDLVVTNPPFVISPERRYIYRDSGMGNDEVVRMIVRRVPMFLRENGFCQILCNWAHVGGENWQDRLAAWFEDTGCDAWVMRTDTLDAAAYACKWIRHTERDTSENFNERFQRWTAYYRERNIEAVSGGVITLRRRSAASNWFRADDGPEKMLGPAGESVLLGFELRDFLEANRDDARLLLRAVRVSPDVRLHQTLTPAPDGWMPTETQVCLMRGLGYTGNIDPYMARLMSGCNGKRVLSDVIGEMANSLGKEPSEVIPACLSVIRPLLERGFLLPAEAVNPQAQ